MIQEIIPMIDSTFRTIADREHRGMAGLSMGGNQTCQVTIHNLDKFAYIGAFSGTMNGLSTNALDPATAFNGAFKDGDAFGKKVKLLWIGKGTAEPNRSRAPLGRSGRCWTRPASTTSTSNPRHRPRMADLAQGPR